MPAPDYAAEISALETALATGELRVQQDGEMVIYQSAADQLSRLNYFQRRAAGASPGGAQYATTLAVFGND